MWFSTTNAVPCHWAFNMLGNLGFMPPFVASDLVLCARYILPSQEHQNVELMLCKIAFQLSNKVVALHLDNSTAKA